MRFTFRCLDPHADAPLLHSWVTQPYASFWGMLSSTVDGVVEEYSKIQASGHHHALLGLDGGVPAFLMEEYLPSASPLAAVYAAQPGDMGMHLLVAPPSGGPQPGYTTAVMDAVLDRLFNKPGVERVVVEPDARNTKIHALNERLGFQPAGVVDLPDKQALLSFCSHSDYLAARAALQQSADSSNPIHQGASL
ncbi:acetyltransferase [Arthrobacter sp. CDRTa11]|uniref:GNAT family N-acetyltransferase n=1 Tax=Arthrobacter sp. CDRTa11 TaxID=2651199 RepID=UPI002265F397|nr:GNAT family N-acetyltransferase [Arthrobacter sp. CDRTa11]UZX01616.1 acetyltransferase [Arthrobacter sp. CDRTa11]